MKLFYLKFALLAIISLAGAAVIGQITFDIPFMVTLNKGLAFIVCIVCVVINISFMIFGLSIFFDFKREQKKEEREPIINKPRIKSTVKATNTFKI